MSLSPEEIQHMWQRGYENPLYFLRTVLRDWFPLPPPWVHRGIVAIQTRKPDFLLEFEEGYGPCELDKILRHFTWTDPNTEEKHHIFSLVEKADGGQQIQMTISKNTLILLPRGFSKTTLTMGTTLWSVAYEQTNFDLIVSATAGHAGNFTSSVAHQIENNPVFKMIYGDLRPPQRSGYTWSESEGHLQTLNGIDLMAKGAGSQVRGSNVNAKRPKRILVDDLETRDTVATAEQRKKLRSWYYSDLRYALPRVDKSAHMVVLATLLHPEAIVKVLMDDGSYNVIIFGAVDPDGDALWEEACSLEEFERDKAKMIRLGLKAEFYREMMNKIVSSDSIKFLPEYIREEFRDSASAVRLAIAMDPAISEDRRADFASIAVLGIHPGGLIHVYDLWMKRGASPREKVNQFFDMIFKWNMQTSDAFGIESIAYQAALIHLVQEEMWRQARLRGRHLFFEVQKIGHGANRKVERVEGYLHPRYSAGYITHQRVFPEYNSQLLDWPAGKKDGPDSVAMGISLLDPQAWTASDEPGNEAEEWKDEYEPLPDNFGSIC